MPILENIKRGLYKRGFWGAFLPEPLYRWLYPPQQQHSYSQWFKTICSLKTVQIGTACIATLTLGVFIFGSVLCVFPPALLLPILSPLPLSAAVLLVSIMLSCAASSIIYLLISQYLAKKEDNTFIIEQKLGFLQSLSVGAMFFGLLITLMFPFFSGVSLFLPLSIGISTFCVSAVISLAIKIWFAYKEGVRMEPLPLDGHSTEQETALLRRNSPTRLHEIAKNAKGKHPTAISARPKKKDYTPVSDFSQAGSI